LKLISIFTKPHEPRRIQDVARAHLLLVLLTVALTTWQDRYRSTALVSRYTSPSIPLPRMTVPLPRSTSLRSTPRVSKPSTKFFIARG